MPIDLTKSLPPDSPSALALERGRALRSRVPRRSHDGWSPAPDRTDPIDTLIASNEGRLPELVPIRIGRMLASPFAFLRGSSAVMAADLATTPTSGSIVQACGDAHLANFGVFASPERRLVFDLNDFDETLRGPWEWDLKRLAASFVVAARENGYPEATCREMARLAAWEYRRWMRTYAGMRALQVWYAAIPIESVIERVERARDRAYLDINIEEARQRDHMRALGKLTTKAPGGGWLIRDRPPLLVRLPDDDPGRAVLPALYASYLRSLTPDRRLLVEKHRMLDVALKVVGVGSVGTRCYVAVFAGPAGGPLILQVKEARESVLAPYVRGRHHRHQGQRVVTGQRIMQAVSDSFLGWTKSPATGTEYYVRQLHDMKYGIDIGGLRPAGMRLYAEVCAWALARAHARSGNPAEIAGYLGLGDVSMRPSRASPWRMPTRPNGTMPPLSRRSRRGGSSGNRASDGERPRAVMSVWSARSLVAATAHDRAAASAQGSPVYPSADLVAPCFAYIGPRSALAGPDGFRLSRILTTAEVVPTVAVDLSRQLTGYKGSWPARACVGV